MQRVAIVIGVGLESLALDDKLATCNTVGVAPHDRAEIKRVLKVAFKLREPQHQREWMPLKAQILDGSAICQNPRTEISIGNGYPVDWLPLWCLPEWLPAHRQPQAIS